MPPLLPQLPRLPRLSNCKIPSSSKCTFIQSHSHTTPRIRICHAATQTNSISTTSTANDSNGTLTPTTRQTPQDIALLGGGLSSLTTALFILLLHEKAHPNRKAPRITIYEERREVGGWMRSRRVTPSGTSGSLSETGHQDVQKGEALKDVFIERGPRTIRLGGRSSGAVMLLWLIERLGISRNVELISKKDKAVKERYLYLGQGQGKDGLWRMPSSPRDLIDDLFASDSKLRPSFWYAVLNLFRRYRKPEGLKDESVSSFMGRFFGKGMVDNFLSAMVGGIWAGSVEKLSMKSFMRTLPPIQGLWKMYEAGDLSLWRLSRTKSFGIDYSPSVKLFLDMWFFKDKEFQKLHHSAVGCSAFYMKEGLGQVSGAMGMMLKMMDNVEIKTGISIVSLGSEGDKATVTTESSESPGQHTTQSHELIISTLPPHALLPITSSLVSSNPHPMEASPSVSVGTVTFYIPSAPSTKDLLPYAGFGYLIPSSVPPEANPFNALGVLFESNATPQHDTNIQKGTRLTVMLGGYHWDNVDVDKFSQQDLIDAAKMTVRLHMDIDLDAQPGLFANVDMNKRCIPQHTVGHYERLEDLSDELNHMIGLGKIVLAGTARYGPGVADCVTGSWITAVDTVGIDVQEARRLHQADNEAEMVRMGQRSVRRDGADIDVKSVREVRIGPFALRFGRASVPPKLKEEMSRKDLKEKVKKMVNEEVSKKNDGDKK